MIAKPINTPVTGDRFSESETCRKWPKETSNSHQLLLTKLENVGYGLSISYIKI